MSEDAVVVKEESSFQFVAVVFGNMGARYTAGLSWEERPYFYLDPYMTKVGDLVFIHNGSNFGLARVVRVLDAHDVAAQQIVTKPILGRVEYSPELLATCDAKLVKIREITSDTRVQDAIDKALEKGKPVSYKGKSNGRKLGYGSTNYDEGMVSGGSCPAWDDDV